MLLYYVYCYLFFSVVVGFCCLDGAEEQQIDEVDEIVTSDTVMTQNAKGDKVLATPAVRRLALENKVNIIIKES